MADPDKRIGHARCPLCNNKRASLGVNKKGLAYLVCNACNAQVFARSDRSDDALRALHVPDPQPAPFAYPLPTPEATLPPASPDLAPPPPPPAKRQGWGFMGT